MTVTDETTGLEAWASLWVLIRVKTDCGHEKSLPKP
jgi:hypothetical protein